MGKDFREEEMKEIAFSKFKILPLENIKDGECLKVTGDGQMAFYVVINPQMVMKDRVEAICQMIDVSRRK